MLQGPVTFALDSRKFEYIALDRTGEKQAKRAPTSSNHSEERLP